MLLILKVIKKLLEIAINVLFFYSKSIYYYVLLFLLEYEFRDKKLLSFILLCCSV